MKRPLYLVLAALFATGPVAAQPDKARLLAVFAHPDDEITVAPLLAKYAAEGHEVRLVSVTSGQVGDANTEVPRGDALGAAREAELSCAGEALGIEPPIPLGFMDGDIAGWETLERVRARIREEMHRFEPHVVFTWGPDGLSGHPDHRLVAAVTTEVFQESWTSKNGSPPQKLYAFALPSSSMGDSPQQQRRTTVRDEFVTTVVDASEYFGAMLQAMHCHVTQWAPKERIDRMFEERKAASGGKVALRLVLSTVDVELPESDVLTGVE